MSRIAELLSMKEQLGQVNESKWYKTSGNSTSIKVFKFAEGNSQRYLVGHFTPKPNEDQESFLKRLGKSEGHDPKQLFVAKDDLA